MTGTLHRSTVNAWECDENAHLNVRFYIGKNHQGLIQLLAELGCSESVLDNFDLRIRLASQHIRFHREARLAVPLTVTGHLVNAGPRGVELYSEMRHGRDDTLYTSFASRIEIENSDGTPAAFELGRTGSRNPVPDYAAIRSLHEEPQPELDLERALACGYFETGRGVVMNHECDRGGCMEIFQYAGRISDTIPAFMSAMQSEEEFALRGSGELGSAVVENRADYYGVLNVGDRFVIVSGLRSFTEKTLRLSHLVFNLESGALVMHSQGIGVALDLKSRRAVPFSADRRARMQARLLALESRG